MAKNVTRKRCRTRLISQSRDVFRKHVHSVEREWEIGLEHPAFVDSYSVGSETFEMDDLQREMVALMQKAEIRPELIYAYLTTGLLVTEENENYEKLTPEDRRARDCAIREYTKRFVRRS